MALCVNTAGSAFLAFTATAANISTTIVQNKVYLYTCTSACYISQGANPTASAGAGSTLVQPGQDILITGQNGAKLSVIQAAAGGSATLTPLDPVGNY